jgi:hypothetical protein
MHQTIVCAHCGQIILRMGGAWRFVNAWLTCKECGYQTKVSEAKGTNELINHTEYRFQTRLAIIVSWAGVEIDV